MYSIAIKGHPFRGKEVIQILESLGGKNTVPLKGTEDVYYYIKNCSNKTIHCHDHDYVNKCCKKYTLEEFETRFPVFFKTDSALISPKKLKLYNEMKKERNITLTLEKAKDWYNKGGELKEVALQAYSKEELTKTKLPKTFEEFCDMYPVKGTEAMIACDATIIDCSSLEGKREYEFKDIMPSKKSAEAHLALMQLEQLRDCYRQGDIPDFNNPTNKYCIIKLMNDIDITVTCYSNHFLSFTKKEVAEEFLINFKPLIKIAEDYI